MTLLITGSLGYSQTENDALQRRLPKFVAGAGIEPAPGGYEPPEVPLLYPAIHGV